MTRPEGVLVFGLACAWRLGRDLISERRLVLRPVLDAAAWFAILFVPYFIWRWTYYGWLLPNTFYVKATNGASSAAQGWRYVRSFLTDTGAWLALALSPLLLLSARQAVRDLAALALTIIIPYLAYVSVIGGDFMGLHRFLVPIAALLALLAQELVIAMLDGAVGSWRKRVAVAIVLGSFAMLTTIALRNTSRGGLAWVGAPGIDTPFRLRSATTRWSAIGKWMHRHAPRSAMMSIGPAGAMIWYADMRGLDCHGLADAFIAHHTRAISTRPGHQKWCPEDYLFRRRPEIMNNGWQKRMGPADLDRFAAQGYYFVGVDVPGSGRLNLALRLTEPAAPRLGKPEVQAQAAAQLRLQPHEIRDIWL